jgi:uncharacterized repeat protein (TIGR01451 family)
MKLPLVRSVLLVAGSLWLLPAPLFADAYYWIRKTGPGGVKPGDQITYAIELNNAGPDAVPDAMVTDATPPGLDPGPVTGACAVLPCTVALAAFETKTITATFSVPASYSGPDPIVNTATISSATVTDPFPGDNTATASTAITRVQGFYTLPPCRIADTRGVQGVPIGGPSLAAGATRSFDVRERCGLPGNAIAVSYNITVTGPTGAGNLRLYPGGTTSPASAINYVAGQTRANNGIVPIASDGTVVAQCDQVTGTVDFIMDVNGYFAASEEVPTPPGPHVRVRPAPEAEITFDNVTAGGVTTARVIEFPDNRPAAVDQNLQDFFTPGSPERTLLPNVIVPSYVQALGKGGPGGPPTFVLAIVDTTAQFTRTAEFHGLEDFRLGWHPPCVVAADPTQEPRTFYAREIAKNEPSLVEESAFENPVFVDISSGCGSNKGAGWNFSLYLTGRDARTPLEVARFMLQRMQDALSALTPLITNPIVASQLLTEAQAALGTLDAAPGSSLANVNNFIAIVDGNPAAFNNATQNVAGELAGRGQSARYMIGKLLPTGTIVEFPLPVGNSWPFGITAGPDGNLWFAETFGARVGRITPAGVVTEFGPTGGQPVGITLGSDGNLWYAEHTGQRIGRITPAGAITTFPDPAASYPYGIAAGPDGNLWFTGRLRSRIGRVTTGGVITSFTTSGNPSWIAPGPDGNLWFTLIDGNRIGRISPSGVITEFPIPTAGSGPQGITAGADGNLWFTETTGNKVGRVTPGGAITEFPLPNANSTPWGITSGPDGNLWFTEQTGNRIGRITPAGVVTEFAIPTANSQPYEIVTGPDGHLWFTENGGNAIGRISP